LQRRSLARATGLDELQVIDALYGLRNTGWAPRPFGGSLTSV
jgi:hypothetical protein